MSILLINHLGLMLILILNHVLLLLLGLHLLELGGESIDEVSELLLELVRRQTFYQWVNRLDL